jgi:hypothetical protein
MRTRTLKRRGGLALVLGLLAMLMASAAAGAMPWREFDLPAGGRMILANTGPDDLALVALAFPVGSAHAADNPALVQLAPLLFLRNRALDGETLLERLSDWGWSQRGSVTLESTSLVLHGPRESLAAVLERVVAALAQPDAFRAADRDEAWAELEIRRRRWAQNPEVALRAAMAERRHGAHPYRIGQGQILPAGSGPPADDRLRRWLLEHWGIGGALVLLAGDLEPERLLTVWRRPFEALPATAAASLEAAGAEGGSGRMELDGGGRPNLLLVHYPGPAGDGPAAATFSLAAGVLHQLLKWELAGKGYAFAASAWYDFTQPGPRPLEIQVRGYPTAGTEELLAHLDSLIERLRQGDYSEYQLITAKDNLFERMDAATAASDGPAGIGVGPLLVWAQNLLQHNLYFRRWRDGFERDLMAASKEDVTLAATQWLRDDARTLGLLLSPPELD